MSRVPSGPQTSSGTLDPRPTSLFVKNLGDQGAAERLTAPATTAPDFASGWSADGRSIVSVRVDPTSGNDLWVHDSESGVGERLPFNTRFNESLGKVSPDNHWIAYVTDESGRDEVWVASFPAGKIRRQVSIGGGTSPQWGEGSKEILVFRDAQRLRRRVERPAIPGGRQSERPECAAYQRSGQLASAVESLSVASRPARGRHLTVDLPFDLEMAGCGGPSRSVALWLPVHQERNWWRAGSGVNIDEESTIPSDIVLMTAADHVRPSTDSTRLEER